VKKVYIFYFIDTWSVASSVVSVGFEDVGRTSRWWGCPHRSSHCQRILHNLKGGSCKMFLDFCFLVVNKLERKLKIVTLKFTTCLCLNNCKKIVHIFVIRRLPYFLNYGPTDHFIRYRNSWPVSMITNEFFPWIEFWFSSRPNMCRL